jgi:7,8-dihydropterin-6-yl-methyl-4-(beta-D-ribofuranosyl)aminobenzene 5'-phosphate synthase
MKLTIVYDNKLYRKDIGLKSDWGFSCLIETGKATVLFDIGAKGDILLSNIKKLGFDPKTIDKIAISHEHWDHYGGLKVLATNIDNADLYRLAKQSPSENMHLISAEESLEITEGVYTTGRIEGPVDEHSLVINGKKGWYVLTGCSHPGLEKILHIAKQIGNIIGIIGGFHGFNNFKLIEDLDFICPCHCTAHKEGLKKAYPDKISECGVGKIIDLGIKI